MKEFIIKNWKELTIMILLIITMFLFFVILKPAPDRSELNKYKLEQIDKKINELKILQKNINDSINIYQSRIKTIDQKIENIKIEKKEINNYYTIKKEEIKSANRSQVDSLLRLRYKY